MVIDLDEDQISTFYKRMLLIRRFEESSGQLYLKGKIRGFLHLYIGQEAIAVGAIGLLRNYDYIVSHYRDHGHALARGMDPKVVMAELCGKLTGSSGGKGGSMHLYDKSRNFMGGYAIVGGQLPIAVGLALAIKYKREKGIVVCFFGDGAVNQGEYHEALNLAAMWKLPILFFLENNLYGMGTHVDKTHAGGREIYLTAESYGIAAAQIDGMNILAIREATKNAMSKMESDPGPIFLEAMTYRFRGHSMADPSSYRDNQEVLSWQEMDPIESFKTLVINEGLITEDKLKQLEQSINKTIEEAVNFALESPYPELDSLHNNVYA